MRLEEVVECYNISGDYNFLLKVYAKDMKHCQDFVFNKLGSVKSIGSTHSIFVMCENRNSCNINLETIISCLEAIARNRVPGV